MCKSLGKGLTDQIIGLTGGIATGKSTVGRILSDEGVPVADADVLARQAVKPGSPALAAIVGRYGPGILDGAGGLNRSALAEIIFADRVERGWVEQCIHPYVRRGLAAFALGHRHACTCLIVPLLFEAAMTDLVDEIWVVTCSPERQRARLTERDGLDDAQIAQRLASQWPLEQKIERATLVLTNNGTVAELESRVRLVLAERQCHGWTPSVGEGCSAGETGGQSI